MISTYHPCRREWPIFRNTCLENIRKAKILVSLLNTVEVHLWQFCLTFEMRGKNPWTFPQICKTLQHPHQMKHKVKRSSLLKRLLWSLMTHFVSACNFQPKRNAKSELQHFVIKFTVGKIIHFSIL